MYRTSFKQYRSCLLSFAHCVLKRFCEIANHASYGNTFNALLLLSSSTFNILLLFIILIRNGPCTYFLLHMSIEIQHRYMLILAFQVSAAAHVKEGAKMVS